MAKVVKCRILDETENAVHVIVPIPGAALNTDRQRRVFLPHSHVDKITRCGDAVKRRHEVYVDTCTVSDWLAQKEQL